MIHLIQVFTGSLVALGMVFLIQVAAELSPASALPRLLNSLVGLLMRGCYAAGLVVAKIYRSFLHGPLRWLAIRLIAFSITVVVVGFEAIGSNWQQRTKSPRPSTAGFIPAH